MDRIISFARRIGKRLRAMASKQSKRIAPDDDIPEMTKADFAAAKFLKAEMPDVVEVMKRGARPAKSR